MMREHLIFIVFLKLEDSFLLPEYNIHNFREHTDMMMDLSILAYGAQQTLSAHGAVIVPPAHILLQCSVDQEPGIVRISHSAISHMLLNIPSHLRQGTSEGAFPLIPRPDG